MPQRYMNFTALELKTLQQGLTHTHTHTHIHTRIQTYRHTIRPIWTWLKKTLMEKCDIDGIQNIPDFCMDYNIIMIEAEIA